MYVCWKIIRRLPLLSTRNICEDTLAQLVDEQERLEEEQIRIKKEIVCNLQR